MVIFFLLLLTSRVFVVDLKFGLFGKCFFVVGIDYGEVWGKNMYFSEDLLIQKLNYVGCDVCYGNLFVMFDVNGNVVFLFMCMVSVQVMMFVLV